jgi:UDP-glucose 4-epimerase
MIGSHLVDQLVADPEVEKVTIVDAGFSDDTRANLARAMQSDKVTVAEGDVRDLDQLRTVFEGVEEVYHLAGVMSLDGLGTERWMWEVNADGCFNVLEVAKELGVRKVVASSSAAVYGELAGDTLFREDVYAKPRTIYGATKIAVEALCAAYSGSMGLQTNVLRYGVVYGPRLHRRGKSSMLLTDVIDAFLRGERPEIVGDGSEALEWIYVGDVARANIAAMRAECSGEVFNIGTGVAQLTTELVETIRDVMGTDLEPIYKAPDKPLKYTATTMDVAKAAELIGFRAQTSLLEGLVHQIEFQRSRLGVSS